jgi:hypothetical protein
VTPDELDVALDELEVRVERLRALYEQYFLGIEKIEPAVARKDVDRRIYVLRREQIRNTGKRFRLQMIIQRYNTFAQYWMRICREIENGTYKRHLLKVEKTFGEAKALTIAAKKRFKHRHSEAPEGAKRSSDSGALSLESLRVPQSSAPSALDPIHAGMAPTEPEPSGGAGRAELDDLGSLAPPPKPGIGAEHPRAPAVARTGARPPERKPHRDKQPSIEAFLDDDLDDAFAGFVPSRASIPDGAPPNTPGPAHRAAPPAPRLGARPGAAPPAPNAPRSVAPPPAALRSAAPPPRSVAPPPRSPSPVPPPPRSPAAPRRFEAGAPRSEAPPAQAHAAAPTVARAAPPPKPHAAPAQPPAPPAPSPAAPARPAPPPAQPRAAVAGSARLGGASPLRDDHADGLSDARVRDLHARLLAAKQETREGGQLSLDGLKRTLAATEAKLRAQHGASRRIDFDVVVKDGRAILKPIVK